MLHRQDIETVTHVVELFGFLQNRIRWHAMHNFLRSNLGFGTRIRTASLHLHCA